ncbi:hypothetical protein J4234_00105 [Candidatus Woesearchaeota archaeon]|nr:hypothetical protein [Candidatus Woesearchaeota archaeon]
MYNKKIENVELINKVNFDAKEWASIVLGIRKSLNLSQTELAKRLGFSRYTPMRYENCLKMPRKNSVKKVLEFIDKSNLDIKILKEIGYSCVDGFAKDTKVPKLKLEYSKELAELIGIILGDGEIMKDGTLRVSFDPKKDLNFHYRRTFFLVESLLSNKLHYESYKRFAFYNTAFVRFLNQDCELKSGNKSKNNWEIPKWCFSNEEYLKSAIRGIFDTDGYIGYNSGTVEIMFGRFSKGSTNLIRDIKEGLEKLDFKPIIKYSPDGRCKIRIFGKGDVIKFMMIIGSSNIKNIIRYLLWRLAGYPAKIEHEGMDKLVNMANFLIGNSITTIELPFFWNESNFSNLNNFKDDKTFIEKRLIAPKHL